MEGDDGSDGADDRAFPFRIEHSADGVTEVVERRQQRGAALADAGDGSDEVDERPATRVARFIPLGGVPRRDDEHDGEDVEHDEEEEGGMRERHDEDEEEEGEGEEEGEAGSSECSSMPSEEDEDEGSRPVRPEKMTPASPRSPRGGHEMVERWNEKLRTARAAMEVLQPTEAAAEKGWDKKKKKEPASAELPSEAELDAKVEFALLVNKVHSTRTKLRELTRLREQFRGAPLTSFKLRL
jgi:hypothetical protein